MSISAAASTPPWSWPNGTDPSSSASGTQTGTSAFQASLMQWENSIANGTQTTASTETQTGQPGTDGVQHHHHHHEADGGQQNDGGQNGGSSIQSTLSSLVGDIASALQGNGSGTGVSAGTSGSNGSIQSDANALVAEIAQAMQANGALAGGGATAASADGSAATAGGGSATPGSIQTAGNTLAADIAQAMQAYGANQTASGNILASL